MKPTWANARTSLALAAVVAMGAFSAAPAKADHGSFQLTIGAQRAGVWAPPLYENRPRTIMTPPVYENVVRQVWREPVYETRRIAIEVPARTITRQVPRYDWGRFVGWDFVEEVIEPARTEWRVERVCVREGFYDTVTQPVLVRAGETRVVWEPVLVRPGHWNSPNRLVIAKDRPFQHPHPIGHAHGGRHAQLNVRFGD